MKFGCDRGPICHPMCEFFSNSWFGEEGGEMGQKMRLSLNMIQNIAFQKVILIVHISDLTIAPCSLNLVLNRDNFIVLCTISNPGEGEGEGENEMGQNNGVIAE